MFFNGNNLLQLINGNNWIYKTVLSWRVFAHSRKHVLFYSKKINLPFFFLSLEIGYFRKLAIIVAVLPIRIHLFDSEKKRSVIRFSWDFNRFADWMNWDYLWRLGIKIDTNDTQFIVNVDECWTDNNNNLLRQNGISQKWNKWNDLAVVVVFSIPCAIINWNRIVQYQNAIEMEQRNGNETMWQHNERKWKRIAYREMSSWRHHHHCHCCRRRLRSAIEATNEYIDPFMWLKHYIL